MTKKNIALRVDASAQMGLGHFMRCLTLADALRERGVTTRFLSRNLPVYLQEILESKGHKFAVFRSIGDRAVSDELAHADWLETSQLQDAADSAEALAGLDWDWLVVDHYALDARWETAARTLARKIMVIDDIADRRHDAHVLLDQNLYIDMQARYSRRLNADCVQLLGPQYALLRTEFVQQRENLRPRDGTVKRVLIFFGGTDATNETGKALEAIASLKMPQLGLDIVVGAANEHVSGLAARCGSLGNTRIHRQVSNMAELIDAADFGIGAAGTATWERCALGLPALVMAVAENQIEIAQGVDHFKAQRYLGTCADVSAATLASELAMTIKEPLSLQEMSQKALALVDALGAERLVSVLEAAS